MAVRTISGRVDVGLLGVGWYGSAAEEEGPRAATDCEIVGGSIDRGDNAVAFVSFKNGYCTGTLIAPNVILTAGHCSVVDESCNGGGGPAKYPSVGLHGVWRDGASRSRGAGAAAGVGGEGRRESPASELRVARGRSLAR